MIGVTVPSSGRGRGRQYEFVWKSAQEPVGFPSAGPDRIEEKARRMGFSCASRKHRQYANYMPADDPDWVQVIGEAAPQERSLRVVDLSTGRECEVSGYAPSQFDFGEIFDAEWREISESPALEPGG